MARSRDIEYRVGFSGDVSQLEAAVKKATDSLNKLGTSPDKLRLGLDGAARSALELSNHLSTAFNQNTGKLDLIKFRQQLDASGRSLEAYAADLRRLGPEGEQAFLEMASAIGKAELPLRRTNNIVKQFGVTLWNTARWRITTSAINTFVGGLQQAYGYSKSLDASLNSIRIVTKKSADDMAQFAKQANAAAKTLSTTTTAYTDASLIFYQQGLSDEQVAARTETTIKMANVTGQAAEDISSQMTAIWNNFEDGSKSLENYADSIVALGASTAASSKEIAEGLQKFAPIAETVGLSFDYASAALTTIVQNTRESATAAGTSLKTLFSRLEGLKLGETLDDGTDLNKYSNALMAVGINIKDASGQLKDMDSILDELGAKWKTLARDQQMALAETVGGVRQYAQLVALMDNWSDFQKNLVTSRVADGELQKQADIYAESWEAARNRVKAASEDIYDSLINPEQFIKLDNLLTPLLTNVASMVDAFGGLTGLLPGVVLLMNKAFGDQIAASMRNMVTNIGLITGSEQKHARALQESFATLAKELNLGQEDNEVTRAKLDILTKEVGLYGEINARFDNMHPLQQEQIQNELQLLEIVKERALVVAEEIDQQRALADVSRDKILETANKAIKAPFPADQTSNALLSQSFMNDISKTVGTGQIDVAVEKLISQLDQIAAKNAEILNLRNQFKNLKDVTEENIETAQRLLSSYGKAEGASNDVEVLRKALEKLGIEGANAGEAIQKALRNLNANPKAVQNYYAAVSQLAQAANGAGGNLTQMEQVIQHIQGTASKSSAVFEDWADRVVKLGTAASKTSMAIRAISNLSDVFSKDSGLKASERWSQGLMSIGMLLPLLKPGIEYVKGIANGLKEVQVATEAYEAANEAAAASEETLTAKRTALAEAQANTQTKKIALQSREIEYQHAAVAAAEADTAATEANIAEKEKKAAVQSMEEAQNTEVILQMSEATMAENANTKATENAAVAKEMATKASRRYSAAKGQVTKAAIQEAAAEKAVNKAVEEEAAAAELAAEKERELAAAKEAAATASKLSIGLIAAAVVALVLFYKAAAKAEEAEQKRIKAQRDAANATYKEIEEHQKLINEYQEAQSVYDGSAEAKETLKEKALAAAEAYGIEGAALAALTGNYEAFNKKIASQQRAEMEANKGQLDIAIQNGIFNNTNQWGASQAAINDKTFGRFIQNQIGFDGSQYDFFGLGMLKGSTAEETLANINEVKKHAEEIISQYAYTSEELTTDERNLLIDAQNILKEINKALIDLHQETGEYAALSTSLDLSDQRFNGYKDYYNWVQSQTSTLQGYGLTEAEARSTITTSASNAGYDDYVRIYSIQQDVMDQLKTYPELLDTVKSKFQDITAEEAEVIAYLPWSAVNFNPNNFKKLLSNTEAYVKALQSGSQAAIDMTTAQKLLTQISSGFKAKDLKDFIALLGEDNFREFLALNQEGQTAYLNNYINSKFEQQQKDYKTQIGALQELYKASERTKTLVESMGRAEGVDIEAEAARYEVEQIQWERTLAEVRGYYKNIQKIANDSTLGEDEKTSQIENYKKTITQLLQEQGFEESVIEAILGNEQTAINEINAWFEQVLRESGAGGLIATWLQSISEMGVYSREEENISQTQEAERLAWENKLKQNAEAAKSYTELNKALRSGATNQESYTKRLIELAKQSPRAKNEIDKFMKAMAGAADETWDQVKAMETFEQLLRDDSLATALSKVAEANQKLEAKGHTIEAPKEGGNLDEYETEIHNMAKALSEVYGYTVDDYWVKTHPDIVRNALSQDAEIVRQAGREMDWSTYWNADETLNWLTTFLNDGEKAYALAQALAGVKIDGEGNLDVSAILESARTAGIAVTQLGAILLHMNGAGLSFSMSNIDKVAALLDIINNPNASAPAVSAALQELSQLNAGMEIKATGNQTPISPPSGGGGGGSKKDQTKDLEDTSNRYHEINRELERQDRILSEIDKKINRTYGTDRLKAYQEQQEALNGKLLRQQQLFDEASRHLQEDREKLFTLDENGLPAGFASDLNTYGALTFPELTSYGEFVGYDENGNALYSYQKLREEIVQKYNTAVEGMEDDAKAKEALDKWFDHVVGWLDDYETSLDTYNKTVHEIKQTQRDIFDSQLNEIKYQVEVAIDVRDARKQLREFNKSVAESFGDMVTHGVKAMEAIQTKTQGNITDEINMLKYYQEEYVALQKQRAEAVDGDEINEIIEELKNLEGNIIASGEALLEWLDEFENIYADTLKDAADRFEAFTNQIAHDTDVLGMIKELYALQGVTYKTQQNFSRLQETSMGEYNGYLRQAELNKTWYENASRSLAEYDAKIKELENEVGAENLEGDVRYDALKKSRDALLEEQQKTQKAMLENAQSAMETARQMYLDAIDKYSYDVEQRLSRGLGFDLLQDKYDHFIEKSERYLDPIEEGLEATTWYSKLDADIQKTTNKAYKDRLKALRDEVDVRRENNKLSQYDLDIIEARYQVLQAEMALEDARNNKNQLRLVRDSNGNWNYQYTSNPDDIAEKEAELLAARKNEYEITKERYKELNDELLQMTKEWAEADKKIRQDVANGILTEEEGQARLAELERYYKEKAKYLETELGVAVADMNRAAGESAKLVSQMSDNAYDTVDTMLSNLKENFTDYLDEMSGYIIENFAPEVEKYINRVNGAFDIFKSKVNTVANAIGVDPNNLDSMVTDLNSDIDDLYYAADSATSALWDQLDIVRNLQFGYQDLAISVWEAVTAMQALANSVVSDIQLGSGVDLDTPKSDVPRPTYTDDLSKNMALAEAYGRQTGDYRDYEYWKSQREGYDEAAAEVGLSYATADTATVESTLKGSSDEELAQLVDGVKSIDTTLEDLHDSGTLTQEEYDGIVDAITETKQDFLKMPEGYATGGYTGSWNDSGRLGILHQKELVLNAEDTANMLAAVQVVRGLQDSVFAGIGKTLDSNALATMALLGSRFALAPVAGTAAGELEQHVTIEQVNFPNVTSSREIEEAFENLVNDAAQWARRRKS